MLQWVGKHKVVNHHHDVPFRLLEKKYSFEAKTGSPTNSTNNRIIHGDNLESLKSLLPEFEGRVNCIYIDPPYNTGNEGWVYNDAVNDPKIKKWLGQVVGKEGEDLSRHDKWLCMMFPRLKLLHRLLAHDGVIFVSIDDNEVAHLKMLLDEIFGSSNFVAQIEWQKRYTRSNNTEGFTNIVEHICCYSKSQSFKPNMIAKGEEANARYTNPDNDPRGPWKAASFSNPLSPAERPNLSYEITQPNTGELLIPTKKAWRSSKETFHKYLEEGLVYWGADGKSKTPSIKRFLSEVRDVMPPVNFWDHEFAGNTDNANQELKEIFGDKVFPTPKPSLLIKRILEVSTSKNAIILDSFAGSGTTAHAVLKLNAEDGGNRRFILCEMMDYAETITAERVRRVMSGYGNDITVNVGTGGCFDFYTVGAALFKEDKNINEEVGVAAIRDYVAYTESIPPGNRFDEDNLVSPYALGATNTALWLFHYERDRVTTLDLDFLGSLNIKSLSARPEQFTVYADKCALDKEFLYKHGITFKRIPRDITRF